MNLVLETHSCSESQGFSTVKQKTTNWNRIRILNCPLVYGAWERNHCVQAQQPYPKRADVEMVVMKWGNEINDDIGKQLICESMELKWRLSHLADASIQRYSSLYINASYLPFTGGMRAVLTLNLSAFSPYYMIWHDQSSLIEINTEQS